MQLDSGPRRLWPRGAIASNRKDLDTRELVVTPVRVLVPERASGAASEQVRIIDLQPGAGLLGVSLVVEQMRVDLQRDRGVGVSELP